MEVQRVLHMVGGKGDTSYATNSLLQRTSITKAKPTIERAIANLCSTYTINGESAVSIADLGCSSGPNALFVISFLVDAIERKQKELCQKVPEFRVFLNDLPGNDFNAIFQSLPEFYQTMRDEKGGQGSEPSCFIAAVPGSFYGRLFPVRSMHLIHSSYSLHWLSQVPPLLNGNSASNAPLNKGNIYISKSSPSEVEEAYMEQYSSDLSLFLKYRFKEMVGGGKMVLTLMGRASAHPREDFYIWDYLATVLKAMVLQGAIEEEKLDTFNIPIYYPSAQEIRRIIEEEGSFDVDELAIVEVDWDGNGEKDDKKFQNPSFNNVSSRGWTVAKIMRAISEPLLVNHFGKELNIDDLFYKFSELVDEHMSKNISTYPNLVLSLTSTRSH